MENYIKINENIHRITMKYQDVFTTVYIIKKEDGAILFDVASYNEDVVNEVIPQLEKLGITEKMLKYVFISHNHPDHSGGLDMLMTKYPETCILSRSEELKNKYKDFSFYMPSDNDFIMDEFQVITIPGHSQDSMALFDTNSKTLLTGDCLQMYGLYGSGEWGANISFPKDYMEAISKLRKMDIQAIYTAHDYYPYGYRYYGEKEISDGLDACIEPMYIIRDIINKHPEMNDEEIKLLYNTSNNMPVIGVWVVAAIRKLLHEKYRF